MKNTGDTGSIIGAILTSLIGIFFLLNPFQSRSQVAVEWSNEPGGVAVATDLLHNVYSANWDYNPGGDITLTKRTTGGSILWNATYDNTDDTRHETVTWIETDSQNNCLVAGTIRSGFSNPVNAASLLMKYDSDGNLLWRTVFESSFEGSYTRKILVDSENNTYVLGLGMGSNGLVTRVKKFDPDGIPIWTFYDIEGVGAPINFKFTPDNGLLITARGITGIINGFFKLTASGNLIWSISGITSPTVGDAAGDAFGNTYIINGENVNSNAGSILAKYNPNGILIWSHTNSIAGNKVEVGSDHNPIISGFPSSGGAGAAFMKYDSNGNTLWQNLDADGPELLLLHGQLILDAQNNAYLSAGNLFNMAVCKINSDGSFGWVGLVSGSNSAQSFTVDTDGAVYLIGTTTAKLSQNNLAVNTMGMAKLVVVPNPFSDYFTMATDDSIGQMKVSLYSLNGQLVYENIVAAATKNITVSTIETGVYILIIADRNGVVHKQRIVKR